MREERKERKREVGKRERETKESRGVREKGRMVEDA